MTDPEADIRRGKEAEVLMANETLKAAFDNLKADYIKAWSTTSYNDTDGRERLFLAYQIVGKVQAHLGHVAANGKLASYELLKLKS